VKKLVAIEENEIIRELNNPYIPF